MSTRDLLEDRVAAALREVADATIIPPMPVATSATVRRRRRSPFLVLGATVAHLAMPGDEIEIRRQPGNRKIAKQFVDEGRLAVEIGVEREAGRHFGAVLPGKQ